MADERKSFLLRLPPRLYDELRRLADQEMRSVNGQIEYLLREALRRRGAAAPETPDGGPDPGTPDERPGG